MPLVNLILTWSDKSVLSYDTKVYVPVVTLSTWDNAKLLQQLKSGFKRIINWNKYQSKVTIQAPNPYLDYLIDPSFQGVNRLFVLSFENNTDRAVHTKYYLPTAETKCYDVSIIMSWSIKNSLRKMITFEKPKPVKEMITGLVVY